MNVFKLIQDAQSEWQGPGATGKANSPTRHIPAHPGADDDTDDEEEQARISSNDHTVKEKIEESIGETDGAEPILNLVDEPMDDR